MQKLFIKNIYVPKNSEWDLIWRECDYATYFHSREWAEIWNVYAKGKIYPRPKIVLFSDGKKALIPLSIELGFKGLTKTHISSPVGTFGGWISSDKLNIEHVKLIIDYLLNNYPNLFLLTNPYDKLSSKLREYSTIQDETYAIDLSNGFDVAYKKWRKSQRTKVNHADKAGAVIRLANTLQDWNSYYEVYMDTLRRWGKNATSNFNKELFEDLYSRQSPYIKLYLAIYENKIVAGNIVFCSRKNVFGWHAAALEKYLKTRVVNLIIYNILKDACDNGYSWLDFGPCGGHESVRAFKKEFGTEELPFPIINVETRFKKTLNKMYNVALKMKA